MNLTWKEGRNHNGARYFFGVDARERTVVSVCERSSNPDLGIYSGPFTRWVVFATNNIDNVCGDFPNNLDDEAVKAMAFLLWKTSEYAA